MHILVKEFNQLNTSELYEILQLRAEVFVVEQNCVYQDIDGKDQKALHILGYIKEKLVAYTRCFQPGDYFKEAAIGRVVVKKSQRNFQLGHQIMEASIQVIQIHFNTYEIKISAQTYLKKFYNNLGFLETGKEYLEDEIPHIAMIFNPYN